MLRHLVFIIAVLWMGLAMPMLHGLAAAKPQVSIYYPSVLSARERQDVLKTGLAGYDVTVFAKFRDFSEDLKSKETPIVVAPASFQKAHPEYTPVLGFSGHEGRKFKYALLALSEKWNKGNLEEGKIGLVEEVDREQLKGLVSSLLKVNCKFVKTVSKPEDLFPLLVFKTTDFIMISPDNYELLKEKFTAKVYRVTESEAVDNPTVFVRKGSSVDEAIQALKGLPSGVLGPLGFTSIGPIGVAP